MPVAAWREACGGYGYLFGMIISLETPNALLGRQERL
jgi:hypothetical protein